MMNTLRLMKLNYMLDRVVIAEKYELACPIRDIINEIMEGKWKKKQKKKKNDILSTNDIEEVLNELQSDYPKYYGIETDEWIWEYLEFEKVVRYTKNDGYVLTKLGEKFKLGNKKASQIESDAKKNKNNT